MSLHLQSNPIKEATLECPVFRQGNQHSYLLKISELISRKARIWTYVLWSRYSGTQPCTRSKPATTGCIQLLPEAATLQACLSGKLAGTNIINAHVWGLPLCFNISEFHTLTHTILRLMLIAFQYGRTKGFILYKVPRPLTIIWFGGWKNCSVVKSTYCTWKGHGFVHVAFCASCSRRFDTSDFCRFLHVHARCTDTQQEHTCT